jgi:hypothetical protein
LKTWRSIEKTMTTIDAAIMNTTAPAAYRKFGRQQR